MHILFPTEKKIPALKYGGTERVLMSLIQGLNELGHKCSVLTSNQDIKDSQHFTVIRRGQSFDIDKDIPNDVDFIHNHFDMNVPNSKPSLFTVHGNIYDPNVKIPKNTNFLTQNHAQRHGWNYFVYNGLELSSVPPLITSKSSDFVFLGKAAWKLKNVKGCIELAKKTKNKIHVLGGSRVNFKMGFRATFTPLAKFYGMVDDNEKNNVLSKHSTLLFNVLWDEPFGLAIIEAMVNGCFVIGTPWGSLPELVDEDSGFLSESMSEQVNYIRSLSNKIIDRNAIRKRALKKFSHTAMAKNYLELYEQIIKEGQLSNTGNFHSAKQNKYEMKK